MFFLVSKTVRNLSGDVFHLHAKHFCELFDRQPASVPSPQDLSHGVWSDPHFGGDPSPLTALTADDIAHFLWVDLHAIKFLHDVNIRSSYAVFKHNLRFNYIFTQLKSEMI